MTGIWKRHEEDTKIRNLPIEPLAFKLQFGLIVRRLCIREGKLVEGVNTCELYCVKLTEEISKEIRQDVCVEKAKRDGWIGRLIGQSREEDTVEGGRRVNVRDQDNGRVERIGRGRGKRNGKGRKSILDDFALTVQRSVPSIYPSYYIVSCGAGYAEGIALRFWIL